MQIQYELLRTTSKRIFESYIWKFEANKEFMENLSYSCQLGVERRQINY